MVFFAPFQKLQKANRIHDSLYSLTSINSFCSEFWSNTYLVSEDVHATHIYPLLNSEFDSAEITVHFWIEGPSTAYLYSAGLGLSEILTLLAHRLFIPTLDIPCIICTCTFRLTRLLVTYSSGHLGLALKWREMNLYCWHVMISRTSNCGVCSQFLICVRS